MVQMTKVRARVTATLHDGTSMIVLSKGKVVPVPTSSLQFLRDRNAIEGVASAKGGTNEPPQQQAPVQGQSGSDDEGGLGTLTLKDHGGGWFSIMRGHEEVEKIQGEAKAKERLAALEAEDGGEGPPA